MRPLWPAKADRYVARSVLMAVLMALTVFAVLNLVFAVADEMGGTRGAYGPWQAFQYVLLTSPRRTLESLPYVALVGALAGLGRLASTSELVVLRAAGLSTARIALAALLPTLPLMVLAVYLGESVVPAAETQAETLKRTARNSGAAGGPGVATAGPGHWLRQQNTWVHVGATDGNGDIQDLVLYEVGPDGLVLQRRAATAAYLPDQGWQLAQVQLAHLDGNELTLQDKTRDLWQTDAGPQVLQARLRLLPDRLALTDLVFQAAWLERQGQDAGEYRLAFWRKVLQPLAVAALTLIGISFIFGPLRETSMGARLAAGIGVGLGFKYLQDLLGPASIVFGFAPLLAVLLPVLLCGVLGLWLLRRAG